MNWGRPILFATVLAAIGTVAALTQLPPDARSEAREGGVPLVKAEPGPIKVKPKDPGGLEVPHKDKSIYERLERQRKVAPAGDPGKAPKAAAPKAASPKPAPGKAGERKLAQAIGPYRVQLGSFEHPATAEKRWQELRRRHADLMAPLRMVVERVELKARGTMYRLQAGPLKSPEDVQKLCAALQKRKVGCFLVKS